MNNFADRVLQWFGRHGRSNLPWQVEPTPYRVWISEIMLQQTQVATVIPYYERFMQSFADATALADADIDDVLHHWSGLGYYARARNLHKAACIIRDRHKGEFPAAFDEVIALPGIGRSTAGAILALSRNERHAILDGNVKRVLARFHAIDGWPGNTAVADELWQHAERHTPQQDVASYTQAMMDLGATLCTRTRPHCTACPLAADCKAHAQGQETDYPGKKPKKAKPQRRTHMILAQCDGAVYLERRPAAGIWGGLWSFPELDAREQLDAWCHDRLQARPADIEHWETVRHSFTHFDLDIEPLAVRVERRSRTVADGDNGVWFEFAAPQKLGFAAPVTGLMKKLQEQISNATNG